MEDFTATEAAQELARFAFLAKGLHSSRAKVTYTPTGEQFFVLNRLGQTFQVNDIDSGASTYRELVDYFLNLIQPKSVDELQPGDLVETVGHSQVVIVGDAEFYDGTPAFRLVGHDGGVSIYPKNTFLSFYSFLKRTPIDAYSVETAWETIYLDRRAGKMEECFV